MRVFLLVVAALAASLAYWLTMLSREARRDGGTYARANVVGRRRPTAGRLAGAAVACAVLTVVCLAALQAG
jgi:hypothetical protein